MKKILLPAVLLFLTVAGYAQVQVIAHRGASWDAPENTVASSLLAWKMGAHAVELDLYTTKDGRLVCIHDSNTKRIAGDSLSVRQSTFAQLRRLDMGSFKGVQFAGEKIPAFEELINAMPDGKELVVEIKDRNVNIDRMMAIIRPHSARKKFSFICFGLDKIIAVKKAFPSFKACWLCNNTDTVFAYADKAAAAGLNGVSLQHSIIDAAMVDFVTHKGLELFTYTVNEVVEAQRLAALGVKGITTDRPDLLIKYLVPQYGLTGRMTDPRDGTVYKTVQLGGQTWMAENLHYQAPGGSYAYNDNDSLARLYGRLYTLEAAQQACPAGWHLPGKEEWETMLALLGGGGVAGGKLKSTERWIPPNTGATNESYFNILPAGSRYHSDGSFNNMGDHACFWTATIFDHQTAWFLYVNHDRNKAYFNRLRNTSGFSVRCLKNEHGL